MGKFSGILITSDIDGTLYGSDFTLHKENIDAIKYFTSEGGLFTLASGRMHGDVCTIGKDICNTYCLGCNGGIIGTAEKIIYKAKFQPELFNVFLEICEKFPQSDAEFCTPNCIYSYNSNKYTDIHQKFIPEPIIKFDNFADAPLDAYMVAFWTDEETIKELKAYAEETNLKEKCNCYTGFTYSFECSPLGVDKGSSAKRLKELVGAKTLVTVGDNENDLSMIKAGDISFVPKNAKEVIKPFATISLNRTADECIMPELIETLEKML